MIKDKDGFELQIGSRVKATLYYEGSINTIFIESEGIITDGSTFLGDDGRIIQEDTFDNYDVVRFELL